MKFIRLLILGFIMRKKPLNEKALKRILNYLQGKIYSKEGKYSLRDLTILRLSVDSLLRVSDALNLKKNDVITSNGVIRKKFQVKEKKTGKVHEVSLSDKTIQVLGKYLKSRQDENPYLFISRQSGEDKPISSVTWRQALKRHAFNCGLDETTISTHSLRKTIPTMLVNKGVSVTVCKNLLNHSSLQNTIFYLDVSKSESLDIKDKMIDF